MFQPLIFRGVHVVNTRKWWANILWISRRVESWFSMVLAMPKIARSTLRWLAMLFFLVVLPLNAHGRIFQHWKHLNFQVKQNHCNMPFRFNQTNVPTCQKAKHFHAFSVPLSSGGLVDMVTLSKYIILYIGHQSFLLQHPIHINTSCVTQCQTVLIAKNARLQHDFHNIGLTRSKMIIPVPFSGIRVLHRNIFFGGYSGGHGKK